MTEARADRPHVVALAGGVGAARFLRGLVELVDPAGLTVVANTGDDLCLHGLRVCPDIDTIVYTLGQGVDEARGWGRDGDTTHVLDELRDRYGQPGWFTLGDRDLATHLLRTRRLAEGASLTAVIAELAAAWGLGLTVLPMSEDEAPTRIATADGRDLHFQEWWVGERAAPQVAAVRLEAAARTRPAPGVLAAIAAADAVVLCPSNPVVSIGPILAVPGVRDALAEATVVGISPIIGGRVLRGMADRLLAAEGAEVSARGVAERYADVLDGWVIDHADGEARAEIEALVPRVAVTDTVMRSAAVTRALATSALELVGLGVRETR